MLRAINEVENGAVATETLFYFYEPFLVHRSATIVVVLLFLMAIFIQKINSDLVKKFLFWTVRDQFLRQAVELIFFFFFENLKRQFNTARDMVIKSLKQKTSKVEQDEKNNLNRNKFPKNIKRPRRHMNTILTEKRNDNGDQLSKSNDSHSSPGNDSAAKLSVSICFFKGMGFSNFFNQYWWDCLWSFSDLSFKVKYYNKLQVLLVRNYIQI